jgi:hypothetical protein
MAAGSAKQSFLCSYRSIKESRCLPVFDTKQLRRAIAGAPHLPFYWFHKIRFGDAFSKSRFVELPSKNPFVNGLQFSQREWWRIPSNISTASI